MSTNEKKIFLLALMISIANTAVLLSASTVVVAINVGLLKVK